MIITDANINMNAKHEMKVQKRKLFYLRRIRQRELTRQLRQRDCEM